MSPLRQGLTRWRLMGLITILYSSRVLAQTVPPAGSFPTCISPWDLKDSLGRIPCEILQEQMAECTGEAAYPIPPVGTQSLGLYPVPMDSSAVDFTCQCTESIYNLYQACAACQNATDLSSRANWFKSCQMSLSDIPIKTENMTDETFWVDQVYNPAFTVAAALQAAVSNQPPPDTGSPASSSGGDDGSNSPSVSSNSASKPKSNTGMIVGIVVGVIGGLVILALLFFFFYIKRRKSRTAPSAEFMKYAQPNAATIPLTQTTLDEESTSPPMRNSVIRGESGGGLTDESSGEALPGFTPGLFKDPIFEKGAALNIANNAGYTTTGTGSPVTYSPATPSGAGGAGGGHHEQQRLIGPSSSSAGHGQVKRGSL